MKKQPPKSPDPLPIPPMPAMPPAPAQSPFPKIITKSRVNEAAAVGAVAAKGFSWGARRLPWLALGATAGAVAAILLRRK